MGHPMRLELTYEGFLLRYGKRPNEWGTQWELN